MKFIYYRIKRLIFKKKDWKGFPIVKKGYILWRYAIAPVKTWDKYQKDLLRALEVTDVNLFNDKDLMDFMFNLKYHRCSRLLMSLREMLNMYRAVKKTEHLDGSIAEVGVYRGGSAAILAHFKGSRHLYLFDTFEGLPDVNQEKDILHKGQMKDTSEQMVRDLLKDYNNFTIMKGIFPSTSDPVKNITFSLVHLDTDLYDFTLLSLEFFYPRMQKGGMLITHDYSDLVTPGVKLAYDEFFADKPETIIEIWDTHALIIKL